MVPGVGADVRGLVGVDPLGRLVGQKGVFGLGKGLDVAPAVVKQVGINACLAQELAKPVVVVAGIADEIDAQSGVLLLRSQNSMSRGC